MKKIYYLLLLALVSMTVTMTSCDDWDEPWDGPFSNGMKSIEGSWVSEYGHDFYGEYDIWGYDVVCFEFYGNHTGRYTYYSAYHIYCVGFDWNIYSNNRLCIDYYDGDWEDLYFGFDRYGYLILSTDSWFNEYTAYYSGGMRYVSDGEISPYGPRNGARKSDSVTMVKSVSRGIKARVTDGE